MCSTDPETIEKIYFEIVAQIKNYLKKGAKVRVSFRVGVLEAKNGELNWNSINEDSIRQTTHQLSRRDRESDKGSTRQSLGQTIVGSVAKKDLSVATPSYFTTMNP